MRHWGWGRQLRASGFGSVLLIPGLSNPCPYSRERCVPHTCAFLFLISIHVWKWLVLLLLLHILFIFGYDQPIAWLLVLSDGGLFQPTALWLWGAESHHPLPWHSVVDGHSTLFYFSAVLYPVGLRLCVELLLKSFQKDSSIETIHWDSSRTSLESWFEHWNMGLNLTELYNSCYYYYYYY